MNPFVNPKKRGVLLPSGCKDLMDVLRHCKRKDAADCSTQVIRPEVRVGTVEQTGHYMVRLSSPTAQNSVLTIASLDGQMRVVLERSVSGLTIFPVMGAVGVEKDVEDFFASHAINPCVDFLVGEPGKPSHVLGFPLSFDSSSTVVLTRDLLRSVFGLDAETEIEFMYLDMSPA